MQVESTSQLGTPEPYLQYYGDSEAAKPILGGMDPKNPGSALDKSDPKAEDSEYVPSAYDFSKGAWTKCVVGSRINT